mmetsp:Transcript_37390/g.61468  ORF Transcript_37390/g.61468 Transcript_37390/m.61468 type:complete len:349 (+) Transcript_37390:2515-3561(+)
MHQAPGTLPAPPRTHTAMGGKEKTVMVRKGLGRALRSVKRPHTRVPVATMGLKSALQSRHFLEGLAAGGAPARRMRHPHVVSIQASAHPAAPGLCRRPSTPSKSGKRRAPNTRNRGATGSCCWLPSPFAVPSIGGVPPQTAIGSRRLGANGRRLLASRRAHNDRLWITDKRPCLPPGCPQRTQRNGTSLDADAAPALPLLQAGVSRPAMSLSTGGRGSALPGPAASSGPPCSSWAPGGWPPSSSPRPCRRTRWRPPHGRPARPSPLGSGRSPRCCSAQTAGWGSAPAPDNNTPAPSPAPHCWHGSARCCTGCSSGRMDRSPASEPRSSSAGPPHTHQPPGPTSRRGST